MKWEEGVANCGRSCSRTLLIVLLPIIIITILSWSENESGNFFLFCRLISSCRVDIRFHGGFANGYDDADLDDVADHDDDKDDENADDQVYIHDVWR